ncbi:MAG: hypothetical protein RI900_1688 [Actinomycetota bacterium]|jgi:hypothetical protein
MSTTVRFWLDPLCPYCWVTSLWLRDVAPQRDLEISWQPISLLVKNELPEDSPWYDVAMRGFKMLRLLEAVRAEVGEQAVGDLYMEFGRRIHHDGDTEFDMADALAAVGLPAGLAPRFDDESLDDEVLRRHREGLALVGNDVGTPIIGIPGRDGTEVGVFGPVITSKPEGDDALALWDASVTLARTPQFFELKRTRTSGPNAGPRP